MGSVRVAIVGVGNCATSLIQGVEYYKDADPQSTVPGLMHVEFGDYHVSDVEFVAAFDVDDKKVGKDLSEAINASENNTIKICDVPTMGVEVLRGPTLDGLGKYYRMTIEESAAEPVDVVNNVGSLVFEDGSGESRCATVNFDESRTTSAKVSCASQSALKRTLVRSGSRIRANTKVCTRPPTSPPPAVVARRKRYGIERNRVPAMVSARCGLRPGGTGQAGCGRFCPR